MYKLDELNTKEVADLQPIAKELNIKKFDKLKKEELVYAILDHQAENAKTTKDPIQKQRPRTNSKRNKPAKVEKERVQQKKEEEQKATPLNQQNDESNNKSKTPLHKKAVKQEENTHPKPKKN